MMLRGRLALGLSAAALVAGALVTWSRAPDVRPARPRTAVEPPADIAVELAAPAEIATADVRLEQARSEPGSRRAVAEGVSIEPELRTETLFGTLRVHVRSRDTGEPLAEVRVLIEPVGNYVWSSARSGGEPRASREREWTGEDGLVEFEVAPGQDYALTATRGDTYVELVEASVSALSRAEVRDIDLEFPTAELPFVARVVASAGGEPLPGASYLIGDFLLGSADAHGYFEALLPSWKSFWVMVEAPGYAGAVAETGHGHESRADALVIRLHRSARLDALVLARDGSPLEGARVRLSTYFLNVRQSSSDGVELVRRPPWSSAGRLGELEWTGRTGADGRCSVGDLPPLAQLECWTETGLRRRQPDLLLAPDEVREVVFHIGSGATIAGRLIDGSGGDAAGVTVWLAAAEAGSPGFFASYQDPVAETVTGAGGSFELADVADGTWWVGPAPGGPYPPKAEVVEVVDGVPDRTVLLEVTRGLFIEGRVVDPSGAPIERAMVFLLGEEGQGLNEPADDAGAFSVGPVARGSYILSVLASGRVRSGPIGVEAGDRPVVVQLEPGGSIRGTLVDGDSGTAVEGDVLVLDTGAGRWPTWTRDGGRFEVDGLPAGLYHVSAATEGRGFALETNVAVAVGAAPSEVLLRAWPGAALHLRYEGDRPYGEFQALVGDVVVASGSVKRDDLASRVMPVGSLRLECSWEGCAEPEVHELTLAVGEERELVFGGEE